MISGTLKCKYLTDAVTLAPDYRTGGQVSWECPSNIALIKYWGKKPVQQPLNPSLSFTLSKCVTRLTAEFSVAPEYSFSLAFLFDGKPEPVFEKKIEDYLHHLMPYLPFLEHTRLNLRSANSFPHSSGIASSASSFAALALTLCSIEQHISGTGSHHWPFFRKASFLARLGSGSACRSVFGGPVVWGHHDLLQDSDDEFAIPAGSGIHPVFNNFRDSILIVDSGPKPVSSRAGHKLMESHPYAMARAVQANTNLIRLIKVLQTGNLPGFFEITENEAMSLHALMMSSDPGIILFRPNTVEIINRIREFRVKTGIPAGFTLDAGANVHLIYPVSQERLVHRFLEQELRRFCENDRVIHDHMGKGPNRTL